MRFHSLSLFSCGRVFGSIFNFNFKCNLNTNRPSGFGCTSPNTIIQALPAAVATNLLRCPHPTTLVLRNSSSGNSNNRCTRRNQKMRSRSEHQHQQQSINNNANDISLISSNPNVIKLRQIMQSNSSNNWEKCWEEGLTPWDLGQATPVLVNLHQTGALPKGRALVPGCGSGHDVVEIACPERYVVGVDISETAVMKAKELSSSLPNSDNFTFLKEDFFTWHTSELFDLIFDYTFFCAIKPDMRPAWASRMRDLLKPDGELITLMFPISDHVGGPPYKVSIADYEEVLHPMGLEAVSIVENELVIGPRKGREKLGRWKKFVSQSLP